MLERILDKDNLNRAYKKVKANRGAGGIDGLGVEDMLPYLREHGTELIQQIREGKYKPNPVRRVEITKGHITHPQVPECGGHDRRNV